MTGEQFDIIFRGDIVLGHNLADVKARLQQLFKTDAARIDALFSGRPVALKKSLDADTAEKYRTVLTKVGAVVQLRTSGEEPSKVLPPKVRRLSLAPVGSLLVAANEKAAPAVVEIDTSALSLREQTGRLVDQAELPDSIPVTINSLEVDLAPLGERLVREDEVAHLPLLEIELEDWQLAETGADLLTSDERAAPIVPVISVPDFGLAPVGADMGQLKDDRPALTPDISKLRLAE